MIRSYQIALAGLVCLAGASIAWPTAAQASAQAAPFWDSAIGQRFEEKASALASRPRTRIVWMRMAVHPIGEFYPDPVAYLAVRARVGGRVGYLSARFTQTSSPPGQNHPVFARARFRRQKFQDVRCQVHRFTWNLSLRFFGVQRLRVAMRARTSRRDWSEIRARHFDVFD